MLERVDQLKTPPVVGKFYLVPTVFYTGWYCRAHWPVLGPRHEDTEHLGFAWLHYHVDIRFCGPQLQRSMSGDFRSELVSFVAARTPLMNQYGSPPPPHPVLRAMKCHSAGHDYPHDAAATSRQFKALWRSFAGHQCKAGKSGWICPHRQFPLGSIEAVNGIITCPLHGLRIAAASGVCIGLAKTVSPPVIESSVLQSPLASPDPHQKEATGS